MEDSNIHYFLKCTNCGFMTEILDKNIPYCINCTLRFSNSYLFWRIRFVDQKTIEEYKSHVCLKLTIDEINNSVKINNEQTAIVNPTKEQIQRRAYIKAGIPLDSGGHYEWDKKQIKRYLIFLVILFGTVALITLLF